MSPLIQRRIGLVIAVLAVAACVGAALTVSAPSAWALLVPGGACVSVLGAIIAMAADARDPELDR